MRFHFVHLGIFAGAFIASGCISYPADSAFFDSGEIQTYERESKDLKLALAQGAISRDEYDQAERQLQSEFGSGSGIVRMSRVLSPEQAAKFIAEPGRTTRKPQRHAVDDLPGPWPVY